MKKYIFLIFILYLFFVGCSQLKPSMAINNGTNPPLNVKVRKNVGDTIFEQFNYTVVKGAHLKNNYYSSFGIFGEFNITKQDNLIKYSNGKKILYCFNPGLVDSVCFGKINKKNKTFNGFYLYGNWISLKKPLEYIDFNIINSNTIGYRYQLIYDGIDNNSLKLTYREFSDNMARPAFYQTVSYKINPKFPQKIHFKNVTILIYNINNQYIEYEVQTPFK